MTLPVCVVVQPLTPSRFRSSGPERCAPARIACPAVPCNSIRNPSSTIEWEGRDLGGGLLGRSKWEGHQEFGNTQIYARAQGRRAQSALLWRAHITRSKKSKRVLKIQKLPVQCQIFRQKATNLDNSYSAEVALQISTARCQHSQKVK